MLMLEFSGLPDLMPSGKTNLTGTTKDSSCPVRSMGSVNISEGAGDVSGTSSSRFSGVMVILDARNPLAGSPLVLTRTGTDAR